MYCTIIDPIEIDREHRSVRKDGQEIHLTGLEYGQKGIYTKSVLKVRSLGHGPVMVPF